MTALREAFEKIEQRIVAACTRAGRDRSSVELIAVSKRQPQQRIEAAFALGQRDFGENYAQELRDKAQGLVSLEGLRWHAIGSLQKNKCKYVARTATMFHALDTLETAEALGRLRDTRPLPCFVEVNVGGELSKAGVREQELAAFLKAARMVPGISLVGLMALPPLDSARPDATRPYFRRLKELADAEGLSHLSMGTTADFEVAIEEGATHIRVGTALFGERPSRAAE